MNIDLSKLSKKRKIALTVVGVFYIFFLFATLGTSAVLNEVVVTTIIFITIAALLSLWVK